ncbi:MAG: peptidase [Deltaproteobacteria bacterium]|nr:MAG: peptidase [Deltaproteobacteria bacterium]
MKESKGSSSKLYLGGIVVLAACCVMAGMIISSSFRLPEIGQAAPFWEEGNKEASPVVVLPSLRVLVKKTKPAVVNISTSKTVHSKDMFKKFYGPGGDMGPFGDFFNKFFENFPDRVMKQRSLGSGFIISKDGYILTNYHVIKDADEISVSLVNKEKFDAKVIGKDKTTDIALIKINPKKKDLPVLVLGDSDKIDVGDWVIAIGNPFGLGHTVTQGIVSAKERIIGAGPYDNFIQTDAAINPGNSGGPLINLKGEVVGINTAIVATGQGIGFAIPINMAKSILPDLRQKGSVARGWLGVAIQDVTPEIAKAVGLAKAHGAIVSKVYPGDPADKAGIKKGDVIIKVNGHEIKDTHDLTRLIGSLKPGSKVRIVVWRGKKEISLMARLKQRTEEHIAGLQGEQGGHEKVVKKDKLGISVRGITPEIARQYNLESKEGVIVMGVDPKGPASSSGLRRGDIIEEVNGHPIHGVKDYLEQVNKAKKGDSILLLVMRAGNPLYIAIEVK